MTILNATFCAVALAAAPALVSAPARASTHDTVAPGYHIESAIQVPLYATFTALPHDGVLIFDGIEVYASFPNSRFAAHIASTPSFGYPSFVLVDPAGSFAILGESSHGNLFRTDFGTEHLATIAQVPLNFDAAWEDSGHFLLSASPCMLICGSDIFRVDAASGARTPVAHVAGPSGPLALTADGDLYYGRQATTYPPPAGSLFVLRWSAAQVRSGAVLSESDAEVVVSGLDGIASIDVDPVRRHLWVAESRESGGSQILEYRLDGQPLGTVVSSPNWIANVDTSAVHTPAHPDQLRRSGGPLVLRYASIDYSVGRSDLVTVLASPIRMPRAHL